MSDDNKSEKLTIAAIKKKYGDVFLSAAMLEERSGGITPLTLGFDIAMNGGIVDGTLILITGFSRTGKSTLCLTYAAQAQKRGKKVYYVDIEGRLRKELYRSIPGLDTSPDKFQIIQSTRNIVLTAETANNIVITLLQTEPNIVIIYDSVGALIDDAGYSAQFGEAKKMMNIPSLMYQLARKAAPVLPATSSNLLLISHTQTTIDKYKPHTDVGGVGIQYEASYYLQCTASQETPQSDDKKTGRCSTFKILKCATGPGTGKIPFYIEYNCGYNRELDIANIAQELGIINQSGAWYSFQLEGQDEVKCQGQSNLVKYLKENEKISNDLEKLIKELTFGSEIQEPIKTKNKKT